MSAHHGAHIQTRLRGAFAIGIVLNIVIVVAEVLAGYFSNSMALVADAGHNLTDILSLVLAGGALWFAQRPTSTRRTYGFRRATILAALANALILILVSIGLAWGSLARIFVPQPVNEPIVIVVAAFAVVVNGITALLFLKDQRRDLNVRAVFLHMAADAALSLGVVLSAIGVLVSGWLRLDPAMSLIIVIAILWTTWGLLRESFDLSLDAVPKNIDSDAVRSYLRGLPAVSEVHHLHVWAMSTSEVALTAHLVKPDGVLDDALLARVRLELHERFGIGHVALQLERGDGARPGCGVERPQS
ncbi:MAG: cation diffusion facilitator family transporter [Gammaproteobacteria bacterium]